jgi:hypothetical protein
MGVALLEARYLDREPSWVGGRLEKLSTAAHPLFSRVHTVAKFVTEGVRPQVLKTV